MPKPEGAWGVVAASALGLATGIATTIVATFGIFSAALTVEFGWNQGDIFAALMVVTVVAAVLAPLMGAWVDRYGVRRVIGLSFIAEALIFLSFYWQGESLASFYGRYAALAFLGLGTTHVAFARLITVWFEARRGLALGFALSGVGIGGFLWPLLIQGVIENFGWRLAYVSITSVILIITVPVLFIWVREPSRTQGSQSDSVSRRDTPRNEAATDRTAQSSPLLTGLSLGEAVRQGVFWRLVLAFFLVGFAIQSLLVHVVPLLRLRSIDASYAALAQSLMFVAVTSGRLVTGWMMDRIFAPRVAAGFVIVALAGVMLMASAQSGVWFLVGALCVGLAVGAEVDVLAYLVSRYFGILSFSQIYGVFYGAYSLSGGVGPWFTALSVDQTGAYDFALMTHVGVLATGAAILWWLPRFQQPSGLQGEPAP